MALRVMGIDPSLAATGVASHYGPLHTVKTKADDPRRLAVMYEKLQRLTFTPEGGEDLPDLFVIEDLPTHAMSAGLTGRAQGIVRLVIAQNARPLIAVTPASLKMFATGMGNAKKPDMRQAWLDFTGEDNKDDNQVDAAWLREIGLYLLGQSDAEPTPKRVQSLQKLRAAGLPEGLPWK